MTEPSHGLDLPRARVLLDEALVGLRGVKDPQVPLRSVERHLVASLAALYRVLAGAGDARELQHQAKLTHHRAEAALSSLKSARSRDPAVAPLIRAVAAVVSGWQQARQRSLPERLSMPRPGPDHVARAQRGVPALVELAREPLVPVIMLPVEEGLELELELPTQEDVPPPGTATLAELDAMLAQARQGQAPEKQAPALLPAPKRQPPPPPEHDEVERAQFGETLEQSVVELERARSFFEDLAMMSLMRQPDEGDLWHELQPVEDRLLARVDGILACGTWVLPELVKLLDERPVPDPEMVWGALFLHGALAGDDALHQVERLLRTVGLEVPEVFDAACDALAFVPHPGLQPLLRQWLRTQEGELQRLAVRVLGRRGWCDAAQALELAGGPSPELAIEGARALVLARGELDPRETARLLRHPSGEVVSCAIEALLLRRSERGILHARALLAEGRGAFADAALWVAIGGGKDALADFDAALKGPVSAAVLEALGWYGDLRYMDLLLGRLEAGQVEAVGALQRLTGASLTDEEPAPEYDKGQEPFVRGFVPPPVELELSKDARVWAAWWKRHQGRATGSRRYRWGHAWSAQDNLWEMEHALASMRERRLAYHELVARTGGTYPFDPRDFVVRQAQAIAQWAQAPELRRVSPGSWTLSFTR
ncbi:MAG TPA: hypothetical protein VK539_12480 [Myxococcaceae bacterium]|nr:hypothetical protein [Myxococcaceae bacterium]